MEKIKFNDGTTLPLHNISSTDTALTFSVLDDNKTGLENILKDEEKTSVMKYISVNEETGDETVLKGYSGYTNLKSIKTEYGAETVIDYDTEDKETDSGFAEEVHDVTTAILIKKAKTESDIAALKESQALQDGAIDDLAEVVSELAEGGAE